MVCENPICLLQIIVKLDLPALSQMVEPRCRKAPCMDKIAEVSKVHDLMVLARVVRSVNLA